MVNPASQELNRVMLDANVLIAGTIWPRWQYTILQHAVRGDFQLVLAPLIIEAARRHIMDIDAKQLPRFEQFLADCSFELVDNPTRKNEILNPTFYKFSHLDRQNRVSKGGKKMVHKLKDYTKAMDFLRADALANHHLLLSLEAGIPGVPHEVYVDNPNAVKSVMNVEHFERKDKSRENWVSLESSQEKLIFSLLHALPSDEEYNFILHRDWMRPLVEQLFGVEFTGKRFDYTVNRKQFCPYTLHKARQLTLDADGELAGKYPLAYGPYGPSLLDLLRKQEMGKGLMVFGIIEKDEIAAHATLEADFSDIWSVHPFTREEYRGKGYGKAVMSQATQVGLSMGKLLYYDAGPNNPPAMKIAEALGYFPYQEVVWGKGRRRNSDLRTYMRLSDWMRYIEAL